MRNINKTRRNKKIPKISLYDKGHAESRKRITFTRKNKTRGRSRSGGEALASGGFGCIFKPALKCKGANFRNDGVSKMSFEKHGKQEIMEIDRIREKLQHVKNYRKYYLLDVDMCKPDKLTQQDMINFDKKCYALTRYKINEKNVNNMLDKLTILNMPDAGVDLKDWLVNDGKITKKKILLLNEIVIKLIQHGVRPMNKSGVIHNDLKDRNIMVDRNLDARIIDWGLSGVVKDNKVPDEIMNRPSQFNTPFSSMLLSDAFKSRYDIFLQRVKDGSMVFNRMNVRNYVINEYLIKLAKDNGYYGYYGDYDDNILVFKMIFSPGISKETFLPEDKRSDVIEYGYYMYYLSNYITDILLKYTNKDMEFEMELYFMECYLYNSDIFGLMTVYYNFFEVKIENIELEEDTKKGYLNRVRSLLVDHIYSNGGEKINTKSLINSVKELQEFIKYENNTDSMRSIKRSRSIGKDITISPISIPPTVSKV